MIHKKYRYNSIFLYASLQFCGNVDTYFIKHTKKLVIFIVQPRIQNAGNLVRYYEKGKLVEESDVTLSSSMVGYYGLWLFHYLRLLFTYFDRSDRVIVITSHPISFFGKTVQELLLNVRHLFWIEYFPRATLVLKLFDDLKNHYHKYVAFTAYFGDRVNQRMNGRVVDSKRRRTILWGLKPKFVKKSFPKGKKTLLFVGVVKESQGLDIVFEYLESHPDISLMIVGVCDQTLYKKYQREIADRNIGSQVMFPNTFMPDAVLLKLSKKCFAGIAPYTTGPSNGTYYIDPGKVKAYTEMGLPVIMTKTSSVAPYIKQYRAGILIDRNARSLGSAITRITKHYRTYLEGVAAFNTFFHYESYYKERFSYIES